MKSKTVIVTDVSLNFMPVKLKVRSATLHCTVCSISSKYKHGWSITENITGKIKKNDHITHKDVLIAGKI